MPKALTRGRVGRLTALASVVAGLFATARAADDPSRFLRDGFESPRPAWTQEQTDATIRLEVQDRSARAAHEGRTSEHFLFDAGVGSAFYYSYPLPRVVVDDALKASLFVRANRVGVQLLARVVLPGDTDPETKQPSFLLVPGTIYDNVDRWQRLELVDLRESLDRQARVLRASTKRPVSLQGAYIEQLVVNLFAGAGRTEVFIDELSVGPTSPSVVAAFAAASEGRKVRADAADGAPAAELQPPEAGPAGATGEATPGASARVRIDRNRLKRRSADGLFHDWVFTGIYAPGADVGSLRNFGFDVWIDEIDADPKRFQEAVARGFLLMPVIGRGPDGAVVDANTAGARTSAFPFRESVAAWVVGDHLGRASDPSARDDEIERARAVISKVRALPPGVSRLTTGIVDDDLPRYARLPRNLDLLGVRPSSWASSMSLTDTYQYLRQRRDLTARNNPGALYWAMLPAAPPAAVVSAVWGRDVPPAGGFPQVQPEQLRLLAYAALSAGYRGIAFRSDAELTRGPGRILLLEMALLNAEIDLFESILANGTDPIPVYGVYKPDPPMLPAGMMRTNQRMPRIPELPPLDTVRASAIGTRDRKGVLLVVSDADVNGQFQPSQMALHDAKVTVIVPEGAQAFEVTPGRVRVLDRERGVGGTRFSIPEFDTSALLLVTTDVAMAERVTEAVRVISPNAALMAIEQAELKLAWVNEVNGRLAADGHYLIEDKERRTRLANGGSIPTDQADLLNKSAENIKAARENLEREDYGAAWSEARRASRPLRILMRGMWDNAYAAMVKANMDPEDVANEELLRTGRAKRKGPPLLVPPVASPALSSFNLLPQHYLWVDWMKSGSFGRNLIPSGSFDEPETLEKEGWANQSYQIEGVKSSVSTVPRGGEKGPRVLKMKVESADAGGLDALPPFIDFPAAAVRSPALKVRAGEFLRISLYVQRSVKSAPGAGGLVVRDSVGGEALQFVSSEPIPARTRLVLYRRVPADGDFTVTLGLAGYGEALFDDLTVERVEAAPGDAPDAGVAESPAPSRPDAAVPTAEARRETPKRPNR